MSIVLIDLHQQRKQLEQYKSLTLNTRQPHINEEQNPQNNNPQHHFPNQMIEQINTSLLSKRVREFLSLGHEACRQRLTSRKREHIHQLKVMKNEHPAFFLEQDDIVNSLNYEGIAVIELQFYHFPDSDRLRVGSVTDTKYGFE